MTIGLLVVQQLILASSTIWIARLIVQIQAGGFSYLLLGLYLASLFLSYVPLSAALVELVKGKMTCNVDYVNDFTSVYRGQITEWSNSARHSMTSSILTGEAPQTINLYLDYVYQFALSGLNVIFNLLILAFILEPWLLATYAIGLLLALLILKLQMSWKRVLSLRAQQGRIQWIAMLLRAWDNILLENVYNFGIWQKKMHQRGKRLTGSNIKLESMSQGINMGMVIALFAPSFVLICYLPVMHGYDLALLAIMAVSLQKLYQVLNYSYDMFFYLADLPMQKSRIQTIIKLLEPSNLQEPEQAYASLEKRIQWEKICVTDNEIQIPAKALLELLPTNGRYTVKGENGTGKSSLLSLLKVVKGREAFYLPVKHELSFRLSKDGFSTGQLVRKTLHELLERLETPIVLLDEWDAYLDNTNQTQLSELIDELSKKKCVIEVRHK